MKIEIDKRYSNITITEDEQNIHIFIPEYHESDLVIDCREIDKEIYIDSHGIVDHIEIINLCDGGTIAVTNRYGRYYPHVHLDFNRLKNISLFNVHIDSCYIESSSIEWFSLRAVDLLDKYITFQTPNLIHLTTELLHNGRHRYIDIHSNELRSLNLSTSIKELSLHDTSKLERCTITNNKDKRTSIHELQLHNVEYVNLNNLDIKKLHIIPQLDRNTIKLISCKIDKLHIEGNDIDSMSFYFNTIAQLLLDIDNIKTFEGEHNVIESINDYRYLSRVVDVVVEQNKIELLKECLRSGDDPLRYSALKILHGLVEKGSIDLNFP